MSLAINQVLPLPSRPFFAFIEELTRVFRSGVMDFSLCFNHNFCAFGNHSRVSGILVAEYFLLSGMKVAENVKSMVCLRPTVTGHSLDTFLKGNLHFEKPARRYVCVSFLQDVVGQILPDLGKTSIDCIYVFHSFFDSRKLHLIPHVSKRWSTDDQSAKCSCPATQGAYPFPDALLSEYDACDDYKRCRAKKQGHSSAGVWSDMAQLRSDQSKSSLHIKALSYYKLIANGPQFILFGANELTQCIHFSEIALASFSFDAFDRLNEIFFQVLRFSEQASVCELKVQVSDKCFVVELPNFQKLAFVDYVVLKQNQQNFSVPFILIFSCYFSHFVVSGRMDLSESTEINFGKFECVGSLKGSERQDFRILNCVSAIEHKFVSLFLFLESVCLVRMSCLQCDRSQVFVANVQGRYTGEPSAQSAEPFSQSTEPRKPALKNSKIQQDAGQQKTSAEANRHQGPIADPLHCFLSSWLSSFLPNTSSDSSQLIGGAA